MNSKVYKSCAVPLCVNTSIKTPNKLFIYVPRNKTMRNKWLKLARRRTAINPNSPLYFCEDHFDLPKDMDNYMKYHVMGSVSQIRMKPGCVPSKFKCQPDRRKRKSNTTVRKNTIKQGSTLIKEEEGSSTTTRHLEPEHTATGSLGTSGTNYSNSSNISNIRTCRICLTDSNFPNLESGSELTHLFEFCVGIRLELGRKPPMSCVFCKSCGDKLREFSEFKKKCIKSEDYWKQMCVEKSKKDTKKHTTIVIKVEPIEAGNETADELESSDENNDAERSKPIEGASNGEAQNESALEMEIYPDINTVLKCEYKEFPGGSINETEEKPDTVSLKLTNTVKEYALEHFDSESEISESELHVSLKPVAATKDKPDIVSKKVTNTVKESGLGHSDSESEMSESELYVSLKAADKNVKTVSESTTGGSLPVEYYESEDESEGHKPDNRDPDYNPSEEEDEEDHALETVSDYNETEEVSNLKYNYEKKITHKKTTPKVKLPPAPCLYCGICEYQSNNIMELRAHWKKHVAKNELNCKQCEYMGRDLADMAAHRYKHHPPEFKHKKQCLMCYQRLGFSNNNFIKYIEFHYRKKHLKKKGGWCNVCGKENKTFQAFLDHDHENRYTCDHCGRDFSRIALKNHLTPKKHTCEQCGKSFLVPSRLNTHILLKHTKESLNLKCDQCDKVYRTTAQLKNHQIRHVLSHVCEVCGAEFAKKTNLQSHQRTHIDDEPYSCNICGKTFKWKCNLNAHVLRHNKEPGH